MASATATPEIALPPVLPPDTRLVLPDENVSSSGLREFPRPVKVEIPGRWEPDDLAEVLEKTDEEFNKIAMKCGIAIVGHAWRLYQLRQGEEQRYGRYVPTPGSNVQHLGLLPPGHILAAVVDVIQGTNELPEEVATEIDHGFYKYRLEADRADGESRPVQLLDLSARRQCVMELTNKEPGNVYYVDIDPRFG